MSNFTLSGVFFELKEILFDRLLILVGIRLVIMELELRRFELWDEGTCDVYLSRNILATNFRVCVII